MKKQKENATNKFRKTMREIRKNPNVGLAEFYREYGKIVQITARSICKSIQQADVVINKVLVKVWQLAQEDSAIENPNGFIYVLTANAAKDTLREREFLQLNEKITDSKDEIDKLISEDAFYSMIFMLSDEEQELMAARFVEKVTFKEFAERKGKNINTISATYYRALEKIKKFMEEKNGD